MSETPAVPAPAIPVEPNVDPELEDVDDLNDGIDHVETTGPAAADEDESQDPEVQA